MSCRTDGLCPNETTRSHQQTKGQPMFLLIPFLIRPIRRLVRHLRATATQSE